MKKQMINIAVMLMIAFNINAQCPVKGDKDNLKFQHLDSLKNRIDSSKVISNITLDDVLKTGDDTKRFNVKQYVKLIGYVIMVKDGGSETCNCHSKDKKDLDIHIEIALNSTDDAKHAMIVEINRYVKILNPKYNTKDLKSLIGKKVKVEGWLFFDSEHKQNAINTSPNGTNIWRATCWEIHPVINIIEIK
jgi:hypothetical protein